MNDSHELANAIRETLFSENEADRNGEAANVVDGLFEIARGLYAIAGSIQRLGNAEASTPYGGLESLGMQLEKSAKIVARALDSAGEVNDA